MSVLNEHRSYVLGIHKDVTDYVKLSVQQERSSHTDLETGLFNQYKFLEDLVSVDEGETFFIFTLPDLKGLQRRWGMDHINRAVSALLSAVGDVVLSEHVIYRFSYDSFIVKCCSLSTYQLMSATSKIKAQFSKQCIRHDLNEVPVLMVMSLPVCSFSDSELVRLIWKLTDYAQMVKDGLYYSGKDKLVIDRYYTLRDELFSDHSSRHITIALQPIVELSSGEVKGFEALARWMHPHLGLISPGEFIPMAEQVGVVDKVGLAVLQQACSFLTKFDKQSDLKPTISVNMSVLQLKDEGTVNQYLRVIEAFGLEPKRVIVEITESYLLDADTNIMGSITELSSKGFGLSLDDFGSGWSAITSLFRLPLTQLKLDKSFVEEALHSPPCLGLISHLADYGSRFGVELVAEGIESFGMLDPLHEAGVTLFQGYALKRPGKPGAFLSESIYSLDYAQ
jgi:EAL domain-containing protein (putative c-di-GMP-specific phosphodiesterase class I)/GGDEF domain-containing protein